MADKTITIDLRAPAHLSDLPAMAPAFFRWWGHELASLLPHGLAGRAAARSRTRLMAGDGSWRLESAATAGRSLVIDPSADDQAIAEQIMRDGGGLELNGLDVLLPRSDALVRRVELPPMSDRDLRAALELQIDRLSPFTSNTARSAYRRAGIEGETGKAVVEVAIVPNVRIEPLERRLQSLGIKPGSIDIEDATGGPAGFDLRKPESADERRQRRILNLSLGLAAAVVWLLALHAWSVAGESEAAAWQARIAELRPAAEQTASLRRRVEGLTQPFVVANAHDPARALSVIAELTRVLPDDARVLELRFDRDRLNLSGLASSAPDLIAKLEASMRFKDVKFTSPITRGGDSAQDRFEIGLVLEERGNP